MITKTNTPKGLTVTVDEAAAFDMLSILSVKCLRLKTSAQPIIELGSHICDQMGGPQGDAYVKVINSREYQTLYESNLALFDGVEKVRHGAGMSAKEFDDLNQTRHKAKQALQRAFWGGELTEIKT